MGHNTTNDQITVPQRGREYEGLIDRGKRQKNL